jgi:hypothetical protein
MATRKPKRTSWRKPHGRSAELGQTLVWETAPKTKSGPPQRVQRLPSDAAATARSRPMVHEQRPACVSSSESAPTSPKASSSSSPRRFASFDAACRELLTGCGAEFFKATGGCRRVWAIARGAAWMTLGQHLVYRILCDISRKSRRLGTQPRERRLGARGASPSACYLEETPASRAEDSK